MLDELYASGNPDWLVAGGNLVAARVGISQFPAEDFFVTALEENPSHRLAAHSLLRYCVTTATVEICKDDDYLGNVSASDATNGAMWAAYAVLQHKHGDKDVALFMLRRAADVSVYDDYFAFYAALFDDLLREHAKLSPRDHFQLVISFARQASNEYRVYGLCKQEQSRSWTESCLRLGRKMEEDREALETVKYGLGLQRLAHSRAGNAEELQAVIERLAELERTPNSRPDPMEFFTEDDDFWRQWLDTFISQGERTAMNFLRERIPVSPHEESRPRTKVTPSPAVQVSEGMSLAAAAKAATAEFFLSENRVPANRKEAGMTPDPTDTHGKYVESVDIVSGAVVITYGREADSLLHGLTVTMTPYATADGSSFIWVCGYAMPHPDLIALSASSQAISTMPPDFIPAACKP